MEGDNRNEDFRNIFAEAVEEALDTLSESGKQAVLYYIEKNFSIKKEEIPNKPEAFAEALQKIFGLGAYVIQKLILQKFYFKLGLEYGVKNGYTFIDYLNEAVSSQKKRVLP